MKNLAVGVSAPAKLPSAQATLEAPPQPPIQAASVSRTGMRMAKSILSRGLAKGCHGTSRLTCHEKLCGHHSRGQVVDAHIGDAEQLQLRLQPPPVLILMLPMHMLSPPISS